MAGQGTYARTICMNGPIVMYSLCVCVYVCVYVWVWVWVCVCVCVWNWVKL